MSVKRINILNKPIKHHHRAYFVDKSKKRIKLLQDSSYNINLQTNFKDFYVDVKCPKCNGTFDFKNVNNKLFYECKKCSTTMSFIEYQKRYINLNWHKTVEIGIPLYSWDSLCPNCGNSNPCISYCVNQAVGSEELCMFEPLLLGSVPHLDNFIMKFCRTINLFPDKNNTLSSTIFCMKCDAPYSHEFIKESFLKQQEFDIEFIIKKDTLKNIVNLKVTDLTKLLSNLELLKIKEK